MHLGKLFLRFGWEKKELLLKLEQVSMELQLRQSALVLDWNALSIWAKKICEDKLTGLQKIARQKFSVRRLECFMRIPLGLARADSSR